MRENIVATAINIRGACELPPSEVTRKYVEMALEDLAEMIKGEPPASRAVLTDLLDSLRDTAARYSALII